MLEEVIERTWPPADPLAASGQSEALNPRLPWPWHVHSAHLFPQWEPFSNLQAWVKAMWCWDLLDSMQDRTQLRPLCKLFKISADGCRDLLVSQPPKASLVSKFFCFLNLPLIWSSLPLSLVSFCPQSAGVTFTFHLGKASKLRASSGR